MGHVPLPMRPIPPDASPEEGERIRAEYHAYLEQGIAHAEYKIEETLIVIFFIVVFAILIAGIQ